MDIKKLGKSELQKLKSEIDNQIKAIDAETIEKSTKERELKLMEKSVNISCIKEMQPNDFIFAIGFYSKRNIGVHFTDYCFLTSLVKDEKGGGYRISISHGKEPMGSSSYITDYEANKHYFLFKMCESYHFYTLKPKQWKEDLQEALDYLIKQRRKYFNIENNEIKSDIKGIIREEMKVNNRLIEIENEKSN